MESVGTRKRNIDFLKGILALFIITLHFDFPEFSIARKLFPVSVEMAVPMFLFISGYLGTLSFNKNGIDSFFAAYSHKFWFPKIKRIVFPFVLFFVAEQILFRVWKFYTVDIFEYGVLALLFDFLTGGKGQGSYYFPIMLQYVFVFPVIFFVIKKNGFKGLCGVFGINLLFEVLKQAYGMPEYEYRLLIFRYLYVIAAGCFAAFECDSKGDALYTIKKKPLVSTISFFLGLGFICLFCYTNYRPKIITLWASTSVLCCLYIVPLMSAYVKKVSIRFAPIELLGKASWHIFLFQMLYYVYYYSVASHPIDNLVLRYIGSVLICISGGVLFYFFEKGIFYVKTRVLR